jgi:anti-sigma factor ChrR (cupin superfamily)
LFVLQGRVEDEAGNSYRAGDVLVSEDGSSHELRVVGDEEVIYGAVVIALQFVGDDEDDDD